MIYAFKRAVYTQLESLKNFLLLSLVNTWLNLTNCWFFCMFILVKPLFLCEGYIRPPSRLTSPSKTLIDNSLPKIVLKIWQYIKKHCKNLWSLYSQFLLLYNMIQDSINSRFKIQNNKDSTKIQDTIKIPQKLYKTH